MAISATPGATWPSRISYLSAGIFASASGTINVVYGWAKGSDPISSLVWAAVAGAVAIVFALSWPATIKALEAKRWSAALMCLAALLLAGSYSVTAALGSAAGGRADAASQETATTDARKRAQASYDSATAELAKIPAARPLVKSRRCSPLPSRPVASWCSSAGAKPCARPTRHSPVSSLAHASATSCKRKSTRRPAS